MGRDCPLRATEKVVYTSKRSLIDVDYRNPDVELTYMHLFSLDFERAKEKVEVHYGGDASYLVTINRAGMLLDTHEQISAPLSMRYWAAWTVRTARLQICRWCMSQTASQSQHQRVIAISKPISARRMDTSRHSELSAGHSSAVCFSKRPKTNGKLPG